MKLNTVLGLVAGLAVSNNVFGAEAGFPGGGYDEEASIRAAMEASMRDTAEATVRPEATRAAVAALFADTNEAVGRNNLELIKRVLGRVQVFTSTHDLTAEQADNLSDYMERLVIAQSDIESKASLGAERAARRSVTARFAATSAARAVDATGSSVAALIARFDGR